MAERTRNPKWSREELILALDFYFKLKDRFPSGSSDLRVVDLSKRLNQLVRPEGISDEAKFRNANGALMKLMNFRRLDPDFQSQGKSGLKNGGKLEEVIWNEFFGKPDILHDAVSRISPKNNSPSDSNSEPFFLFSEIENRILESTFSLMTMGDRIRIFIHSSGGDNGKNQKQNPEYSAALTLLLKRFQESGVILHKVRLASRTVQNMEDSDRELSLAGFQLPIRFIGHEDLKLLQASIQKAGAAAFRKPKANGPGNPAKRLEFEVSAFGSHPEFVSYIKNGNNNEVLRNTWIFQANPDTFDVNSYLESRFAENAPIKWVVRQSSAFVHAGDQVFIWRSAGKKRGEYGIVAFGTILTEPEILPDDSDGLWSSGQTSDELRVAIRLHDIRLSSDEGMVLSNDLIVDPSLQKLRILRLRAETNYIVSPEHASRLSHLWSIEDVQASQLDSVVGFREGEKQERLHVRRERNRKLVGVAKRQFIAKHGRLFCEACGFNALSKYGIDENSLIEAHHNVAVSELEVGSLTYAKDLSMLCPNCHRVVHHRRPWLSVEELRYLIKSKNKI